MVSHKPESFFMLIYCCADLLFSTRIRATAEDTGVPSRPARDAEALTKRLNRVDDGKLNEPVTGVMIDLDLGDAGLALLKTVKAFDANILVVAFGAHVAVELLQAAREAGADFVMPRGTFVTHLPDLVKRLGSPAQKE
jgi:hypothetical protein